MSDTATEEVTAETVPDGDETDADMRPADYDDPAEPDDDDDEPVDDPDPLPVDDEPSAQANAADFEGKLKKLSTSAATWRRRVSDVLGEDAVALVQCELCQPEIPGFHFDLSIMQPMDETQARLLEVLRTPLAPEYVADSGHRQCDACQGWGKVRTGSKVAGQEVGTCGSCSGFGFVPPPGVNASTGEVSSSFIAGPQAPAADPIVEDADVWGSPRILPDGQINPNYGKMPQYKDANLP